MLPPDAMVLADFIRNGTASAAMFDREMNYLAASAQWLRDFGRGHDDLVGLNHYRVHPDLPEEWRRIHRRCLQGETVSHEPDERWVRADGVEEWLHWAVVVPWHGAKGGVGGIVITAEDVTAVRLEASTRRALDVSQAMYAGLVAVSVDAILSVDETQRIKTFNTGAERIFGWKASEILGQPLDVLLPEHTRSAHREHVGCFAAGPDASRHMVERRGATILGLRRSGEEFAASAAISRVDVDGSRLLTVTLRDVSESRRDELEHLVIAEVGQILIAAGTDVKQSIADRREHPRAPQAGRLVRYSPDRRWRSTTAPGRTGDPRARGGLRGARAIRPRAAARTQLRGGRPAASGRRDARGPRRERAGARAPTSA